MVQEKGRTTLLRVLRARLYTAGANEETSQRLLVTPVSASTTTSLPKIDGGASSIASSDSPEHHRHCSSSVGVPGDTLSRGRLLQGDRHALQAPARDRATQPAADEITLLQSQQRSNNNANSNTKTVLLAVGSRRWTSAISGTRTTNRCVVRRQCLGRTQRASSSVYGRRAQQAANNLLAQQLLACKAFPCDER